MDIDGGECRNFEDDGREIKKLLLVDEKWR
jgi:hypothetical protein